MLDLIYDKSDKGREEIASRKHHLAPKLRALLVLIDGKQSGHILLKKFGFLGLSEQVISELIEHGFIKGMAPVAPAASAAAAAAATAPTVAPQKTAPVSAVEARGVEEGILEPGETQYQAVYNFYTHTVKSALGLRGFGMTLKVERCNSLEDFRALRTPYVDAVRKAQGDEMARSLRSRLDQLLDLGEIALQTVPPRAT